MIHNNEFLSYSAFFFLVTLTLFGLQLGYYPLTMTWKEWLTFSWSPRRVRKHD